MSSFAAAPDVIVWDIDSTDDPTHGQQQLSGFHGYYDQHMYHPLVIFDGERGQLVSVVLRPGTAHAARGPAGTATGASTTRYVPPAALERGGDCGVVHTTGARPAPVRVSLGSGVPSVRYDVGRATRPVFGVSVSSSHKVFSLFVVCLRAAGRGPSPPLPNPVRSRAVPLVFRCLAL